MTHEPPPLSSRLRITVDDYVLCDQDCVSIDGSTSIDGVLTVQAVLVLPLGERFAGQSGELLDGYAG